MPAMLRAFLALALAAACLLLWLALRPNRAKVDPTSASRAGIWSPTASTTRTPTCFADYYTSRIDRDFPWLLGMLLATDLRMAKLDLGALHALAEAQRAR
jgi:hypothetical protein